MVFQIHRNRAEQPAGQRTVGVHHKMLRRPAGFSAHATGRLQRRQKFMPQKRIGDAGQPIPVGRRNFSQTVHDADVHFNIVLRSRAQ